MRQRFTTDSDKDQRSLEFVKIKNSQTTMMQDELIWELQNLTTHNQC